MSASLVLGFVAGVAATRQNLFNTGNEIDVSVSPGEDTSGISSEGEITASKLIIDIQGAVPNPGVYEVDEGSIIGDVIELAGGLTEDADKSFIEENINYAKALEDREKVYIPRQSSGESSVSDSSSDVSSQSSLVNINTASQSELETLSGVGPSTAKKIIDGRPYNKLEDLMDVKGIGEATFEKLKDQITL